MAERDTGDGLAAARCEVCPCETNGARTGILKKGGKTMVMFSQTGNTKAFASVHDDKACKMVGKK